MTNNIIENIQIKFLSETPEFIPTLAQWKYDAWNKYDPTLNMDDIIKNLRSKLNTTNKIPITLIAIYNNLPIATVTLKEKIPIPGYEDRDLWLGSFLVHEKYRNQGIGIYIQNYVFSKAKELGYSKISLFASDPKAAEWYAKHQWNIFATDTYQDHPVTLLEHML